MRNLPMPASRARPPTMPLTPGKLMKAPQKDYMSIRQLAFFESLLNAAKRELLESAHAMQVGLQEDEAHADPTDCASVEEEHAMVALMCSREFNQLRKIDEAIDRIHKRSYGWCQESGEPIGLGRLIACPTALFCIETQALPRGLRSRRRGAHRYFFNYGPEPVDVSDFAGGAFVLGSAALGVGGVAVTREER